MLRPWGRKELGVFRKETNGAEARRAVRNMVEEQITELSVSQEGVLALFQCPKKPRCVPSS